MMTIQELIDQLQEAIKSGYPPETAIRADVFNDDGFYTCDNLLLDASSDYLPIPYLALNVGGHMTITNLDLLKQALLLAVTAPSNRVDAAVELADYFRSICTPEELEEAKRYVEEAIS